MPAPARPITVLSDCAIFTRLSTGGIARYFSEIWARVPARHPDIRFVLRWSADAGPAPSGPGITVVRDPVAWRPTRVFGAWNESRRRGALARIEADLFHSTYYESSPIDGLPEVVTVHDMADEHFFDGFSGNPREFRLQLRGQLARARHVIAVSETTRQDAIRFAGVNSAAVSVCHHGAASAIEPATPVATDAFRRCYNLDRPYLLYVGRQNLYKNFATLLEGWRLARERGLDLLLVCAGETSHLAPNHFDFLTRHRLLTHFRQLPRLDDTGLGAAYAGAEALVFPSLWEGFGLPVLEAAAAGVPLVLSDIPAFHEVAAAAALYFDPCDPSALAAALDRLRDTATVAAHREQARQLAGRYSWDDCADRHAAIYRRLARGTLQPDLD